MEEPLSRGVPAVVYRQQVEIAIPVLFGFLSECANIGAIAAKLDTLTQTMFKANTRVHQDWCVPCREKWNKDLHEDIRRRKARLTRPPPLEGNKFYADKILAVRGRSSAVGPEFLVRWSGHGPEHDTWQLMEDVGAMGEEHLRRQDSLKAKRTPPKRPKPSVLHEPRDEKKQNTHSGGLGEAAAETPLTPKRDRRAACKGPYVQS